MYCQKCRTPLKLDRSLESLNLTSFDLLVGSYEKAHRTGIKSPSTLAPSPLRKDLYDRASKSTSPIHKRVIPPPPEDGGDKITQASAIPRPDFPDMSFIEITESQVVSSSETQARTKNQTEESTVASSEEKPPLSWEAKRAERLFAILSSHSDVDHPICGECTSLLLSSFNSRLAAATRERDAYVSFLKSSQSTAASEPSQEEIQEAEMELSHALEQEKASLSELEKLEEERHTLESEISALEEESKALGREEETFWASRNAIEEELYELTTELASLQDKYTHDQQQLERLQRTNVFNDTFCIGHDGFFVTINGLRLGRLPNQHVEWAEINAAWGQALLLLATVAEKLGFEFKGYRLKPLGSTSRIEKVEWPQQAPHPISQQSGSGNTRQAPPKPTPKITPLDLFSSGDMPLGRVFYHRRFDAGMVAFLACLAQLGDHVEKMSSSSAPDNRPGLVRSPSLRKQSERNGVLPYPIQGDKIGDPEIGQAVSIKLGAGFQQDESWTKACKYALTCCKFLLAYVSNLSSARDTRG